MDALAEQGIGVIKVYDGLSREAYFAAADHGPASDSALSARERLVGVLASSDPDPAECGHVLERMEINVTWLTPNPDSPPR